MSEENGVMLIVEERQELTGWVDDAGRVCLRREALDPSATQTMCFLIGEIEDVREALATLSRESLAG